MTRVSEGRGARALGQGIERGWLRSLDRLLPEAAGSWGFEDLRRARILLSVVAVASFAYGVIGLVEFRVGTAELGVAYSSGAVLLLLAPLVLRLTGSPAAASHLFLAVVSGVILAVTWASGGGALGVLYSSCVVPLLAVLLGGRSFAGAWTGLVVLGLGGAMLAVQQGFDFPLQPDAEVVAVAKFRGAMVLAITVLVIALAYESIKNRAFRDLAKAYARVESEQERRARSERALRASEERFRTLFQSALVCIHEIDLDGRLLSMNPAGLRIMGAESEAEIRGLAYAGLVEAEDRDRIAALLDAAYAGQVCEFEFAATLGNSRRSFASSLIPLRDGQGKVVKLIGHTQDISEQKRAEQELRASEAKYQDLYEHAPDMFASVDAATSRVVECNRTLALALGSSKERILGRSVYELYHPSCHAAVEESLRSFVDEGEVQTEGLRLLRSDGSCIDVSLRVSAVRDPDGRVLSSRSIWRDVTEEKRAQESLRSSEERLAMALEVTSEGLWDWNLETGEVFISDRWFEALGYRPGELPARVGSWESLVHPEDVPRVRQVLQEHLEGRTPFYECENRLRTRSGGWRHNLARGRVVARDEAGRPLRMVGVDVDISDRKRAEEALQQARKREGLEVLAGGIAHDFNNLLVGILGSAELALADLPSDSPVHDRIAGIKASSEQAAELAHQLRVYTGKGKLRNEALDLARLAGETTAMLRPTIAPGVRLEWKPLEGPEPGIQADATQVRQVVMNLVTNAAQSMDEAGGRIVLRAGVCDLDRSELERCFIREGVRDGRYSYLEVRDDGSGMDAATLERIFDPFFSTKGKGRGLGLASALGVMRGHRGTLRVESSPGEGTTFRLLFPYARAEPATESGEAKPLAAAGGRVLLVDDDPTVLAVTQAMLRRAGFDVLAVRSGEEALRVFRDDRVGFCAVMLDLSMPGMDGEETLRALRSLRSDLPAVFFSGHSEEDGASLVRKHARAAFLAKPFTSALLAARFGELLGGGEGAAP